MKKSELKELINPIVKECVNENIQAILLDSGLLSQIISEVVKGFQPVLVENKTSITQKAVDRDSDEYMRELLKKSKDKKITSIDKELINNRASFRGINIFEGIKEPIPDEPVSNGPGSAMYGIAPDDEGVDISGLFDPRKAQALMKGNK